MASKEDIDTKVAAIGETRSPNRLIVYDSTDNNDNNSVICLSPAKMEELSLFRGDEVLVSGKNGRDTVCIVLTDKTCNDSNVRMNKVVRKNLGVTLSDVVTISQLADVPYGKVVHILPLNNTLEGLNLLNNFLKPYFSEAYRPVKKGDLFLVRNANNVELEFAVVETDPAPHCIVSPDTLIICAEDFEDSWHSSLEDDSTIESDDLWSDEDENSVVEDSPNDVCTFIEVHERRLDKLIITLHIYELHQDVDVVVELDPNGITLFSESRDFDDVGFDYNYWKRFSDAVRNSNSLNAIEIQFVIEADFNPNTARCIGTFYDGLKKNTSILELSLEVFPHYHSHPDFDLEYFLIHNTRLALLRLQSDELLSNDQGLAISLAVGNAPTISLAVGMPTTEFDLDISDCRLNDKNFNQIIVSCCQKVGRISLSCREMSHCASLAWLLRNTSVLSRVTLTEYNNEEGISLILSSLTQNTTIERLELPEINEDLCNSFLCDCTSISSVHNSNHTVRAICINNNRYYGRFEDKPGMMNDCLSLNTIPDKMKVIREKISRFYFIGAYDISPFVNMPVSLLPEMMCLIKGDGIGAILRLLKGIPDLCNVSSRDVNVSERIKRSDVKRQKTDN